MGGAVAAFMANCTARYRVAGVRKRHCRSVRPRLHYSGTKGRAAAEGGLNIDSKTMALDAARAAQDKKGQNLTIIDLRRSSTYTDALVIATAYSDRQTQAIADSVQDVLRQDHGCRPLHREGQGPWILLDYGDIVVHVFHEDARAFYALDQLWADAPRIEVPPPARFGTAHAG